METALFFIEPLSNLHVGSGEINYGLVDNLIQRDPVTNLPTINSSSLKGALREHFELLMGNNSNYVINIFGSNPKETKKRQPGTLRFFEADLLSIAVRSTGNNLAYVNATSKGAIDRLCKRLEQFGVEAKHLAELTGLQESGKVSIEDLPGKKSYCQIKDNPSLVGDNLAVLDENDLKLLCNNEHLPVISRNCLEDGQSTNLFYEQVLPRYSRLATLIMGDREILDDFSNKLNNEVVQIGGNATIGYGYCKFTICSTSKINQ